MAMIYVQQRTSIPIPKVHMCFEHDGTTYIVMDRLKGLCLEQALDDATSQTLRGFATQLAGFVRELRALDPRTMMGSWPSGPYDNLFFDPPPLHEFRDVAEFHSYWIWRLGSEMGLPEVPLALRDVDRPCSVVLTHGDLAPRNIMVDGEKITGLVDWETLGWYPDFWESDTSKRCRRAICLCVARCPFRALG
ncbi:kinase-like domain-containing protein [Crassisporium funariophilum]|nr:kinase-like domain-containing protein [Crassisporium funariophilum]